MYSCGPPHMDVQKQDDQHELTYSNYVRTQDVTLKTYWRRWMIGRSGERGSGISVLAARHDDDDDFYLIKFTSPSARVGYDTRSIFKLSLTGLNSEFPFCLTKAEELSLPYYLHIAGGRIIGFMTFPKGMWNAISLVQDLNSCRRVHFLRR